MRSIARRGVVIAVVGAVVAILVGGAVLALQDTDDEGGPAPAAQQYDEAGVPWWDGRRVHWAGQATRADDVASYTATRDAAIYLHDRLGYDDGTVPEPYQGTLSALFEDGQVQQLATRVVGVPMADPTGRIVAWTTEVDREAATLTAYDTVERAELGTRRIELDGAELNGVLSVVGETVTFSSGRRLFEWRPLDGGSAPVDVGRSPNPFAGQVGSPSPDGRFLVTTTDDEDNYDRVVIAVASGDPVGLGLPGGRQVYQARWASDGRLVAATVSADELADGWDDALDVTSYACDVPAGTCGPLRGGPRFVGALALYEDNLLGLFFTAYEASGLS